MLLVGELILGLLQFRDLTFLLLYSLGLSVGCLLALLHPLRNGSGHRGHLLDKPVDDVAQRLYVCLQSAGERRLHATLNTLKFGNERFEFLGQLVETCVDFAKVEFVQRIAKHLGGFVGRGNSSFSALESLGIDGR